MAVLPFCKRLTFTEAYNGKYGVLVVTAEEAFFHIRAPSTIFWRLHVLLIDKEETMFFNNISVYEQILRSKILPKKMDFFFFFGLTLQIGILIQRHVFHKYVVIIINDCDI